MTYSSGMRSALYQGSVLHRRPTPDGHRFTQPVRMVLLDLDEVDAVCGLHPLWSARHAAPLRFRRSDYLGPTAVPLDEAVADVVEDRTGERPTGPISVLTHLRSWGWLFNPISCYFCFDSTGESVTSLVVEVTNTPWHQRHDYVVGPPGVHHMAKELHVSPFLGMDQTYRLTYSTPGDDLEVEFVVSGPLGPSLVAGVRLQRQPLDRLHMGQMVWAPQQGAPGVSFGIYRQALALKRKGARFYPHPNTRPSARATESKGPSRA